MKDRALVNWSVFVFLFIILIGRILLEESNGKMINIISFIGVIISLYDLYTKLYLDNYKQDKFKMITGIAIVIACVLMLVLVGVFLDVVVWESKGSDVLTILALLITLPSDLYCNWIKKYVNN